MEENLLGEMLRRLARSWLVLIVPVLPCADVCHERGRSLDVLRSICPDELEAASPAFSNRETIAETLLPVPLAGTGIGISDERSYVEPVNVSELEGSCLAAPPDSLSGCNGSGKRLRSLDGICDIHPGVGALIVLERDGGKWRVASVIVGSLPRGSGAFPERGLTNEAGRELGRML